MKTTYVNGRKHLIAEDGCRIAKIDDDGVYRFEVILAVGDIGQGYIDITETEAQRRTEERERLAEQMMN